VVVVEITIRVNNGIHQLHTSFAETVCIGTHFYLSSTRQNQGRLRKRAVPTCQGRERLPERVHGDLRRHQGPILQASISAGNFYK
jgi:hypothetical protein